MQGNVATIPGRRMRHHIALFVLTGPAAWGGSSEPTNPTATTQVDVRDNVFVPAAITAGTQAPVTWTWRGAAAPNAHFGEGQGSSTPRAAGTHSRAFAAAGTYRYRCTIHSTSFT